MKLFELSLFILYCIESHILIIIIMIYISFFSLKMIWCNITFFKTRTHAAFAERQIRTIKDMIHKRMKVSAGDQWTDHIGYVLLTYTHKMASNTTHMTPYEARKPKHQLMAN